MSNKPRKTSAVKKLELSRLRPGAIQRELMGDDLDLQKMLVYLMSKVKLNVVDRITDLTINRTIEGASTIVMEINDHDRAVLRSGTLNNRLDIELDGLWFRLVKVEKDGDRLSLTFEDREIAILRKYNKFKMVKRTNATRAEFVNNLIREVKEFRIPTIIPQMHKVQPIETSTDVPAWETQTEEKTGGIPKDDYIPGVTDVPSSSQAAKTGSARTKITVKGVPITDEQIKNANTIIHVGSSMGARRKVLVAAIMVAIQESGIRNLPYGMGTSLGIFQQTDVGWGSRAERLDPVVASRMFFLKAISADAADPTRPYWDLGQAVQASRDGTLYAKWHTEAHRIVTAYGMPGADSESSAAGANNSHEGDFSGSDYIYYRGKPKDGGKKFDKEDSWACTQRLADEVGWRAFFVSGTFYYISEDALFKSRPLATLTEFSKGVEGLDGDYDSGKKSAELTLIARVGTWLVPPGAVIVLQDMGPWNGRWLVNTFNRSAFGSVATITLKKPRPRLPEPSQNDINTLSPTWAAPEEPTSEPDHGQTGGYTNPLPTKMGTNSEFATVDPEGAPDRAGVRHHAGKDWFAPGGTDVVAPTRGTIVEVKLSKGSTGQIFGGVVKLQQDNGYVWVFRHVDPASPLTEGSHVDEGRIIASVTTWGTNPSSSHAHIEIWRTLAGGYNYENMIDPVLFIQGKAA